MLTAAGAPLIKELTAELLLPRFLFFFFPGPCFILFSPNHPQNLESARQAGTQHDG